MKAAPSPKKAIVKSTAEAEIISTEISAITGGQGRGVTMISDFGFQISDFGSKKYEPIYLLESADSSIMRERTFRPI